MHEILQILGKSSQSQVKAVIPLLDKIDQTVHPLKYVSNVKHII